MAELDHWHPVMRAGDLGTRPRAVTLCDTDIVLFRTASNRVGALHDVCPHRRMQLSTGWVEGENLVCPYHGFSYGIDGKGHSPATPRLRLCAGHFTAIERHGAIWVKSASSAPRFPAVERSGFHAFGLRSDLVRAPLELLVDNFSEVEHTPTTHLLLGYARDALDQVETQVIKTADSVRVINRGPQKKLPFVVERLFGMRTGDWFVDDWTVRFSPVHIVYSQWWADPRTGARRPDELHLAVFFNPVDPDETQLMTFVHSNRPRFGRLGLDWLIARPIMLGLVAHEVSLDRRMVEQLADQEVSLEGTRLGRFDSPLRELRRRIDRIYRGRAA